jgi:hypothetical protein
MPVPPPRRAEEPFVGVLGGLWGLVYAVLEPRLTALRGWWAGGLVFGLAPLIVYWFVVLPLKGLGVGGGFHLAMVRIEVAFHAVFGIGTAIVLRSGLVLARRNVMP